MRRVHSDMFIQYDDALNARATTQRLHFANTAKSPMK